MAHAETLRFEPVGVVVRIEGGGMLLQNPSKIAAGPSPRVKFGETYYTSRDLKIGQPVQNGNVVRTGPSSKAVIAFVNGDHFAVGPGTEYEIRWKAGADSAEKRGTQVELHFGSIRGVIQPGGENQGMRLRSRAATMGVRGTEFYIEDAGTGPAESKIAVLRGKVEVSILSPVSAKKGAPLRESKPQAVEAGTVATVVAPILSQKYRDPKTFDAMEAEESAINVAPLNKAEVAEIRKTTAVPPPPPAPLPSPSASALPVAADAAAGESPATPDLEAAMGRALLADIRTHEPELYQQIEKSGEAGAAAPALEKVQEASFSKIEQKAPEAPPEAVKPSKPNLEQLKTRGDAIYEEYLPPTVK